MNNRRLHNWHKVPSKPVLIHKWLFWWSIVVLAAVLASVVYLTVNPR